VMRSNVEAWWFNRPILETLKWLELRREEVWGAGEEPTLWNASLFPVTSADEAWLCARWMMGYTSGPEAAAELRRTLSPETPERGCVVTYRIAQEGLRVRLGDEAFNEARHAVTAEN
jgi:hypothetical protein